MDKHWILHPVILRMSSTGGNYFAAVEYFDANIAISGNFVLNAKNSIKPCLNSELPFYISVSVMPDYFAQCWHFTEQYFSKFTL